MYQTSSSNNSESDFSCFSYTQNNYSNYSSTMSQTEYDLRAYLGPSQEIKKESYETNTNYYNSSQSKRGRKPQHLSKINQIFSPNEINMRECSRQSQNDDDYVFESLLKAYQSGILSKAKYKRLIANERERRRMHGLNDAFEHLRSVLPSLGSNKQFSKYETLQMAKRYISALREILCQDLPTGSNHFATSNNNQFYN